MNRQAVRTDENQTSPLIERPLCLLNVFDQIRRMDAQIQRLGFQRTGFSEQLNQLNRQGVAGGALKRQYVQAVVQQAAFGSKRSQHERQVVIARVGQMFLAFVQPLLALVSDHGLK